VVVVVLVEALTGMQNAAFAQTGELQLVRLKAAGAELRRVILDGHARSEQFRTLVDEIQRSNAVVIVQFGLCANGRFRSCVTSVDGDSRQRHVRVKIKPRTTDDRLIATVAHELQHVVEILRMPNVTDAEAALKLYRRIGTGRCREGLSEACETEAALDVEARVLDDLWGVARR
jgi:uncharacterized protein YjaZ